MNLSAENIGKIRDLVRSGYPLKARDAQDLLGHNDHLIELLGARFRLMLSVEIERDQLKAECEALRSQNNEFRRAAGSMNLGGFGDAFYMVADRLGITGPRHDSPMQVFASEILPALDAAIKDAERLRSATAFAQKLCDSAGKQPSVATGYLHDILDAMGKDGRP